MMSNNISHWLVFVQRIQSAQTARALVIIVFEKLCLIARHNVRESEASCTFEHLK
jgi:hypothetical protein